MGKKNQTASCVFGAKYILGQVDALTGEIQGAIGGDDIEHIHRLRVASRRLRNGLDLFKDCLPKKKAKDWMRGVRKVTKALGRARDLDIQILCLEDLMAETLPATALPGYERVLLRLSQQREKAQNKVNQSLTQLKEDKTLEIIQSYCIQSANLSEAIYLFTPSLYKRAFSAIHKALEEFLAYEKYLDDPENIEELHAMRIAGKHLRYTLEIFSSLYGKPLLPHLSVMKELQDQLGDIHDIDVWIGWLPKFIDQERARVEAYFGHPGPFDDLLPGIQHLIEDRATARRDRYDALITLWETLTYERAWSVLRDIVKAPLDFEAASDHLHDNVTSTKNTTDVDHVHIEGEEPE